MSEVSVLWLFKCEPEINTGTNEIKHNHALAITRARDSPRASKLVMKVALRSWNLISVIPIPMQNSRVTRACSPCSHSPRRGRTKLNHQTLEQSALVST
jgi:hypothetical protein